MRSNSDKLKNTYKNFYISVWLLTTSILPPTCTCLLDPSFQFNGLIFTSSVTSCSFGTSRFLSTPWGCGSHPAQLMPIAIYPFSAVVLPNWVSEPPWLHCQFLSGKLIRPKQIGEALPSHFNPSCWASRMARLPSVVILLHKMLNWQLVSTELGETQMGFTFSGTDSYSALGLWGCSYSLQKCEVAQHRFKGGSWVNFWYLPYLKHLVKVQYNQGHF